MAEVDSRIPLQIRVPEFQTPFETTGGALSLKQLMQNVEMQPLELQIRQEQMRGLQDYRAMMMAARAEDQRLRSREIEKKRRSGIIGLSKEALASSQGLFLMSGDAEAAKELFAQKMQPIWDVIYTPEQQQQAKAQWSPENVQKFLAPESEGQLYRMADTVAIKAPQLMWDTGEPAYERNYQAGAGGEMIPVAGQRLAGPNVPEWATREPQSPEDWQKWDALIAAGREAKWFKGSEQMLVTPFGTFSNPRWLQSQRQKMALEEESYARKQKVKTPDTVFMGADPLEKAARVKVQEKLIDITLAKQRLTNIQETFRPEFQQLPTEAAMWSLEQLSQLGVNLDPQMQAKVSDYITFKEDAWEHFNRYVKEITGAQMSENEVQRLRFAIPDPKRDGPIAFKSKLDRSMVILDRNATELQKLLDKGIDLRQAQGEIEIKLKNELRAAGKAQPKAPVKAPATTKPAESSAKPADPLGIR